MELWIGAINLGFLYSFMAIGTFITYKIYNFPDITIDGTFTTGAAIVSVLIIMNVNPTTALIIAFAGGAFGGVFTGIIHTKFKINGLLAGILVMTGLYSINLRIMGKSNIPLLNSPGFVTSFEELNPGMHSELWLFICLCIIMLLFWFTISIFFKTDFGITMRATGSNPQMVTANGVNENTLKIFGIALANGFVGISGGLVAQYQGFADIGMGVGSVVASLAAVIIGEAIIKHRSIFIKVLSVIVGSIIFRLMVALALLVGLNPNDLKLITAIFVLLTLITTGAFGFRKKIFKLDPLKRFKKVIYASSSIVIIVIAVYYFSTKIFSSDKKNVVKIGIILSNDTQILTDTRDGFLEKMKELGYNDYNCSINTLNANGDIPTINTIVDNFINKGIDIYLPISTPSTQATLNKVKDKPIVFATVANPFIIGAGESDTKHPANITGIYGTMPIADLMKIARKLYPKSFRIGVIWNPAFANSVDNVNKLKSVIAEDRQIIFNGTTITSTTEVYQAASSLVNSGIDAFFLVPDIFVYSAFESIVKAAKKANIPIFTGDVERLPDGALAVAGYEYLGSGYQAAMIVDRIIKGENPSEIPFERYKSTTIGINYDVAKKLGIAFPDDIIKITNAKVENKILSKKENELAPAKTLSVKKLAVFQFTENPLLNATAKGVIDAINKDGFAGKYNITIERYNAHADFNTAQSIAKDIVSKKFDYISTISTIALQVTANNNKNIPHVFAAVTDPIVAGVAENFSNHFPNLTGLATPQPVESTVKFMRELFPRAKTIGIIWNPSEANSEVCTKMAREACKKYNFRLVEKTISNTNEIEEVLKSIVNEKVELFLTSGDVTVSVVAPTIAKRLVDNKIPYFTNTPDDINSGAFFCIGAEYYDVGYKAGEMLKEVILGKNPKDIPIEKYVPEKYNINLTLAKKFDAKISDSVLKKASIVIQ